MTPVNPLKKLRDAGPETLLRWSWGFRVLWLSEAEAYGVRKYEHIQQVDLVSFGGAVPFSIQLYQAIEDFDPKLKRVLMELTHR